MKEQKITLIYDSECPVCENYCQMVRIKRSIGELTLVSAREESDLVTEIKGKGFNLDNGMVLIIDDQIYGNAETIHALALISSRSNIFNKINYWIFKSEWRSKRLYPVLRFSRRCLLMLLGKNLLHHTS